MGKIGYKRRKNMPYKKNKRIDKLNKGRDKNVPTKKNVSSV